LWYQAPVMSAKSLPEVHPEAGTKKGSTIFMVLPWHIVSY